MNLESKNTRFDGGIFHIDLSGLFRAGGEYADPDYICLVADGAYHEKFSISSQLEVSSSMLHYELGRWGAFRLFRLVEDQYRVWACFREHVLHVRVGDLLHCVFGPLGS